MWNIEEEEMKAISMYNEEMYINLKTMKPVWKHLKKAHENITKEWK